MRILKVTILNVKKNNSHQVGKLFISLEVYYVYWNNNWSPLWFLSEQKLINGNFDIMTILFWFNVF